MLYELFAWVSSSVKFGRWGDLEWPEYAGRGYPFGVKIRGILGNNYVM